MDSTVVQFALFGFILPALIALLVAGLPQLLADRGVSLGGAPRDLAPGVDRATWPIAVGLAVAHFVGHWGVWGWPEFWPQSPESMLAWTSLDVLIVGILEDRFRRPVWVRWIWRVALAGALAPAVLWYLAEGPGAAWMILPALGVLALWGGLDVVGRHAPGPLPASACAASALALAVLLGLGSSVYLAMSGVILAFAYGGVKAVLWWWHPRAALAPGGIPAYAVLAAGFVLHCHHYSYSDVPFGAFVLVYFAPLLSAVELLPALRHRGKWTRWIVGFLPLLLVLAGALLWAWSAMPEADPYY